MPKKIAKKFKNSEKTPFRHYFLPKWDEIGREREKKNLGSNSVHIGPRHGNSERNSKKIKKTSFWQYFKPKPDEIGREREKNILGPNTADTRPRQENSKKNSKKIQKI